MKKSILFSLFCLLALTASAQRVTDKLDRGLIAQKTAKGVFLSWRIFGEEYYDVKYNVYRDGTKITSEPLDVSNYTDAAGTTSNTYTVTAVVRGEEQTQSKPATVWGSSYLEIIPQHDPSLKSTYVPNDACCADVDGDGELEILLKYDNANEIAESYPKDGPKCGGTTGTKEYSLFECLKLDGRVLWWVNCGPNIGDFQNNEANIVAYDWDGDGKAEAVFRAADGTTIHMANGEVYTVGDKSKNYRAATGGGTNWFMHDGAEYLLYVNGETGEPYQCLTYPLARLEPGETDLNAAWGDGYGHRSTKHFFGAPYLDGRKPSIFLARGIYTRHKMVAYDVDPATHKLVQRWKWYNNTNGYWKWQGYHNFGVADVDWDGRDEIVFGSMVIDDNGKGLSTTGLGHGDAQHCGDFNPYIHGQEIYACNEDQPGNNYRDATTSKIYHRFESGNDDGRAMAGNFCNTYPGGQGCSAREGLISLVYNNAIPDMNAGGVNTNFRIYWDGDLLEETFNYVNGKNTEGCVAKYGSWTPIYTCPGSMTNNDTKGTPCYQGDLFGDWREEIMMRTANNHIRIYSTPTETKWRNYTLWHDHQYRNAMVWQMCGYNQPPHVSYFLGELEKITVAPPPLTMTGRTEVQNGGTIGKALDGQHVIVCETGNTSINIEEGAKPYILTFNVPSWVQGTAGSEYSAKDAKINYATYTCNVTGGAITGGARLVKQGDGILNLPKVAMTHTGETNIWAGTLNFDGSMLQSTLWLNRFAELNTSGQFRCVKADYASIIRPGGTERGTLTTDSLVLGFGSRLVIDLYSDGLQCDQIQTKLLSIEKKTGAAWSTYGPGYVSPVLEVVAHPEAGSTKLAAGDYILGDAPETVVGNLSNIVIEGLTTQTCELAVKDGKFVFTVGDVRSASKVYWVGDESTKWNFADAQNFQNAEGDKDFFVMGDEVVFDDAASKYSVSLQEELAPSVVTVKGAKNYVFSGTGSIVGEAVLQKEGTCTLTINNENSYTGGNHITAGIVSVSKLANDVQAVGNLGSVTTAANKFTIENGATLQSTAAVTNGSPIQLVGEAGGVINNSADFVQQKAFSGTLLTKQGNGWLKTSASGSNLNRLVIAAGVVQNGDGIAAKVVEFQAGELYDNVGTNNELNIPAKKSGTWRPANRCSYQNKLTGEGKLTVYSAAEKGSNYYATRTPLKLNLSAFAGTLVAQAAYSADGRFTFDTSSGGTKWTLDIPTGIIVQNSGKTLQIGSLTGSGTLGGGCAFSNGTTIPANTWKVGGEDSFTFSGNITENSNFEKTGAGKMTFKGKGSFTGTAKVSAGELCLNSSASDAMLGTGALTVAKGAVLSGKGVLDNASVTVAAGGVLRSGITENNTTGKLAFSDKNVTVSGTIQTSVGSKSSYGKFTDIKTLKLSGTLVVTGRENLALEVGNELQIFDAATITLGDNLQLDLCSPNLAMGLQWDTTRLAEGILVVAPAPDAVQSIAADGLRDAEIYTLSGQRLTQRPTRAGIYIVNGVKTLLK